MGERSPDVGLNENSPDVPSVIRNLSRTAVLELLRAQGPLSRTDIARKTNISLSVVSRIVHKLIQEDRIREVGKAQSSGGRRSTLLSYNFAYGKAVGIDLGATKTALGITDLSGKFLSKRRIATKELVKGGGLIEGIVREVRALLDGAAVDGKELVGIGLGVPGIVQDGSIVAAPGLALHDGEYEIEALIAKAFSIPVWVDNDANAIALGEHWRGSLQGVEDGVCVAIGTGIGVGLLLGGEVYRGAHGAAGEIGYWIFDNAVRTGPAGDSYGFLERFAAGPGIARRARTAVASRSDSILASWAKERPLSAVDVFAAAEMGDAAALEVVKATTDMLGVALSNLASLIDPEVIVITGGVSNAGRMLLDPIAATLAEVTPYPPKVVLSALREDATMLGAVRGVLRKNQSSIRVEMG